jgi:dihydrofolate synthase/folylpolyglutamate synthase
VSRNLADWLAYIEQLHPHAMEPGLERVRAVAHNLGLLPVSATLITVAGTNGKGSCLALMEHLAGAQALRTGVFTSPHLFRFNERIRVDGADASDDALVDALATIDAARGEISLTYFEFATLAALLVFARAEVDLVLLEVGLGGRLDAVNIADPDVAVITSVGLDHTEWLGEDRDTIALEKLGIARPGKPLVFGETDLPASIAARVEQENIPLWCAGQSLGVDDGGVFWHSDGRARHIALAGATLGRDNLATAVQALVLAGVEPSADAIVAAAGLQWPGRAQYLQREGVAWYLDVGHNEEALTRFRQALPVAPPGRTRVVAAMRVDKPARRALHGFVPDVDHWYLAGLPGYRGAGPDAVRSALPASVQAELFSDVAAAVEAAQAAAEPGDRVLVIGSFVTVAAALEVLQGTS